MIAIASAIAVAAWHSRMCPKQRTADLETCRLAQDELGRALSDGRWVRESDAIARQLCALSELHSQAGDLAGRNEAGIALLELARLQAGLAKVAAQNALAEKAAPSRVRLLQARRGLSRTTLLQADNEADLGALTRDADQAWNDGDFETAQRLYDIAYERGSQWLAASNALPDEVGCWRLAAGAAALTKALSAATAQLEALNSRFQAASSQLQRAQSEIVDLRKQYRNAQTAASAATESHERNLKAAEAALAAKERSLLIALAELKDKTDSLEGARADAAYLRAGFVSASKALDGERMARATAEAERDQAFWDWRSKDQELTAKEKDLGGERTRRAMEDYEAARLSQTLFGLRSQVHDHEAVLATVNQQKEVPETMLKALQAVHAQGNGGRSPNNSFSLGGRNRIDAINLGPANPYARFPVNRGAGTWRNPW